MAITVTATQGTDTFNGIALTVKVLTGAAEAGGASNTFHVSPGAGPAAVSLTPNASNSLLVFSTTIDTNNTFTAAANNTYDNNSAAPFGVGVGDGHYTGTVTAGTGVTVGSSAPTVSDHYNCAAYEIRPSGGSTPVLDGSAPAQASTSTAITVTTASFTPPAGAVLVACIESFASGAGSGQTMTVSDTSGLAWTQRAGISFANQSEACFIFTATVPAAAGGVMPHIGGQTWRRLFRHRQQLPPPAAVITAAAPAGMVVFAAPNRRPGPHRAALGARGALAAGILAAGIGPPPAPAPHQPPVITHPAPHRASWRSGRGSPPNAAQQVKAPVPVTVYSRKPHAATWRGGRGMPPAAAPQPFHPATVFTRGAHRVLWRGGSGPAPAAVQGGGAPQPFTPKTVYSRKPHGVTWKAGAGQPPAAARQPFKPVTVFTRAAHRAAWRGIAGPAPVVVQGGGTLQPTRPVTVYVRKAHAAIWRAVTGRPPAAARQPFRPVTVYARKPHRVTWRSGLGSPAAPPPPFTIGALTAADTASGVLTAAGTSSALTAATAAQGILTATDQRTGGPG